MGSGPSWQRRHPAGRRDLGAFPSHVHANWVFTKPGRYTFNVTATAERSGKTLTSNTATYTWVVGEVETPSPKPTSTATARPTSTAPPQPTATKTPMPQPTATSSAPSPRPSRTAAPTVRPSVTQQAPAKRESASAPTPRPMRSPVLEECFPLTEAKPAPAARTVISDGHLDLGAKIEGGALKSVIKDDRSQPAKWLDPSTVTLHLGDKAKAKAPVGLEFIAAAGADVWLSAATQVPGVPWLGQNTMHETVVSDTTGPVVWELKGVKGPGKFAAFNSGMFGGGVGERVFDTVGGPRTYTVRANTHAHPNWVFDKAGHYEVTISPGGHLEIRREGERHSDAALCRRGRPQGGWRGPSRQRAQGRADRLRRALRSPTGRPGNRIARLGRVGDRGPRAAATLIGG